MFDFKNWKLWGLFGLSLVGYIALGQTERTDFARLMVLYSLLFGLLLWMIHLSKKSESTGLAVGFSIALQLSLLFTLPNLSDDYFRFIWDGQLAVHGFSPYGTLPPEIYDTAAPSVPLADTLFANLNVLQKSNYTCYPPFNELFFVLPALVFPKTLLGNVVLMRLFIILANLGTALVGIRILKALGKPTSNILYYSLNPLTIVELAGNLHFEALMVFFLVVAIYFAIGKKHLLSAVAIGLSISVKLVPLALLPVFYKYFGWRKWVAFCAVAGGLTLLLFLPVAVLGGSVGFFKSIGLYFHNFEFNASIFYLFRQVGFWVKGFDMVGVIGPALSLVAFAMIICLAFYRKNQNLGALLESLLLALTAYYLLGTTVHPWYVTTLVALSVFTNFRFPVAWSFAVFVSYAAYATVPFAENPWLVLLEYLLVYAVLFYELSKYRRNNQQLAA